jgi:DEAD/DEAH box helicase domain-containing protein
VNRQIVGFKKVKFYTMENVGAGSLSMPEQEMHTTAFWLRFPEPFLARFPDLTPADKQNGLTGLSHALRTAAAFLLMCDPRDLGVAFGERYDLYLFDNYAGGVGLSAPLFALAPKLLAHAADLLDGCPCEAGCPSCVGPIGEVGERGKEAARRILAELLSAAS